MAGPQHTSEFVTMNRLKSIRDLLPVRFGDTEFIDTVEALASAKEMNSGQMLVVNHNLDHPVMSFRSEPGANAKIGDLIPSVLWSFPAIAAKPTARVLLESGDQVNAEGNQPLMVAGRYGAGSVLYLGFQESFRWRPVGVQAQYFDRFWIQVVLFVVTQKIPNRIICKCNFTSTYEFEFNLMSRIFPTCNMFVLFSYARHG